MILFLPLKKNTFIYFVYFLMAVLGLRRFVWTVSNCGERGLFFVAVLGLLIEVAFLAVEHKLSGCGA